MVGPTLISYTKLKRFNERKDKSLCVQMKTRVNLEKPVIEELVKAIHPDIEKVFFPRQKVPRFFFVLCKNENAMVDVDKAIRTSKSEELGTLFSKKVREKQFQVKDKKATEKGNQKSVDPLTLVLEGIPKSLETEAIKKEFSKCKGVLRFNNSRCYISFKNIPDAFEALKRVKSEPLCGFKITARFDKVVANTKEANEEKETTTMKNNAKKTKEMKSPKNAKKNKKEKVRQIQNEEDISDDST